MFVRALGSSFHWPAMQASTSLMVPKDQLSRVAGLNQTLKGVLNIAGPPLGALLMGIMSFAGIMLIDVGTAAIAILPLFFVLIPQPERRDLTAETPSLWADMREGLRYMLNWPGLVVLIGAAMIFKIALTPAFSLVPLLVSEHFGGDAAQLSLVESTFGIGVVVGGVLLSIWGGFRRKILTSMLGIIVAGLVMFLLGLVPSSLFGLAIGIMFVVGLLIPLIDGPLMALLQGTVAPEMQGRVLTLMSSLLWLTSPLGLALAGPVSDWLGLQVWYLVAGVLCAATGVIGLFIPALMNIEGNVGQSASGAALAPVPVEQ